VVRNAFDHWKAQGIGLEFAEVTSRDEAEVRIGFMQGDGSWSYLGRQVLDRGVNERTMNFGWDLLGSPREADTALHEIGHTLGLPHEHQNPNAGIVWDEEKVYTTLAGPPNSWPRDKTQWNILRKIEPDTVQGSNWDPDSVMEYPFPAGLILQPERYRTEPLRPAGGLSPRDLAWVRAFYPGEEEGELPELLPFQSRELAILAGQQRDLVIRPAATRGYTLQTFGESDTVMGPVRAGGGGAALPGGRRRQRRGPQRHPPAQAVPGPRVRGPDPALLQPGVGRDRHHAVVSR
jgi:hypothetical protein